MRITQAPLICRNRSIVLRKTRNTTGWNRKPTKNFLMNVRMPADSNSAHDDWHTFEPIDTPVRRMVSSYRYLGFGALGLRPHTQASLGRFFCQSFNENLFYSIYNFTNQY